MKNWKSYLMGTVVGSLSAATGAATVITQQMQTGSWSGKQVKSMAIAGAVVGLAN